MAQEESVNEIDAKGLSTIELNIRVKEAAIMGARKIILRNVCGQRYIGTRLRLQNPVEIEIHGTPGNDLGAFADGHRIIVYGNAQDGIGNTMNSGEVIVHGRAGDILGMSMRGGTIYIRDSVGYRAGVHMKEYGEKRPALIIGGSAQDFLGEYMAGGIIVLLGLNLSEGGMNKTDFIGTGMHGGVIYIRAEIQAHQISKHVEVGELDNQDQRLLSGYVSRYSTYFNISESQIMDRGFKKLRPISKRPYGGVYKK